MSSGSVGSGGGADANGSGCVVGGTVDDAAVVVGEVVGELLVPVTSMVTGVPESLAVASGADPPTEDSLPAETAEPPASSSLQPAPNAKIARAPRVTTQRRTHMTARLAQSATAAKAALAASTGRFAV